VALLRALWTEQVESLARSAARLGLAGDGEIQMRLADIRAAIQRPDGFGRALVVPQLQSLQDHLTLLGSIDKAAQLTRAAKFRHQGPRRGGEPAWQRPVRQLYAATPATHGRAVAVWNQVFEEIAEGDDPVFYEAVPGVDRRPSCKRVVGGPCSRQGHVHWWLPGGDRLGTLSRRRVLNYLSALPK